MKVTWKLMFPFLAAMILSACSNNIPQHSALPGSTASVASASLPTGTSGSDRIAPQDLLEIDVFKVPDLSKEVRVDDNGNITDEFVMKACGEFAMVQIEAGQWHALESIEEGSVILECKDGVYEPLSEEDIMQVC